MTDDAQPAATSNGSTMSDLECGACGATIAPEDARELECFGCGRLICARHRGDAWGPHEPSDHISDLDDDDE